MSTIDMSQYLDVYLDEGREQLSLLETSVLQMERGDHSVEILQSIFRAAHTLKGSSRAMGFAGVGDLTHEMENILDDLREGRLSVTTPIIDALLQCLDALTTLIDQISATGADQDSSSGSVAALVKRLNVLRSAGGTANAADTEAPAAIADAPKALQISDFAMTSIHDAQAAGLNILLMEVTLHADCLMKSVRVYMVLGALAPLCSVLVSYPSEEQLDNEDFDRSFQLILASEGTIEAVQEALSQISEVESITITPWQDGKAADEPAAVLQAEAEPKAPAKKTPAGKKATAKTAAASEPPGDLPTVAASAPGNRASDTATPSRSAQKPEVSAEAKSADKSSAHAQTIRVDVARLDSLLNLVGELVIDRTQIARIAGDLRRRYQHDDHVGQLIEATHRVARISGELQDEIMKTRMLPIDGVFQRMPRMVRDLAQKTGKQVDFRMWGGDTELDRSVLEVLGDPLIHLLRNSVDHGIEPPDEREAAGKAPAGVVSLSARHEENHIVIEITDDGRGIDPEKIKRAAVKKGILNQASSDAMSDRDAMHLIFASGFSTAETVSDISGRGVGMDIVKSNLEKLGGRILVDSVVGSGSRFCIHLPLTLAIVRALLVSAGGGTYVLPLGSVVEMLRLGSNEGEIPRRSVAGQGAIVLRGRTVPLANLANALAGCADAASLECIPEDAYVVIVGWAEKQVGLCVDALLGEQEVVIKSLGTLLGDIRGLAGATILGDGSVALILDPVRAVEAIQSVILSEGQAIR